MRQLISVASLYDHPILVFKHGLNFFPNPQKENEGKKEHLHL